MTTQSPDRDRRTDTYFRLKLQDAHSALTSVKDMHEDADEALVLVDGLLARLWDENGMPRDPFDEEHA